MKKISVAKKVMAILAAVSFTVAFSFSFLESAAEDEMLKSKEALSGCLNEQARARPNRPVLGEGEFIIDYEYTVAELAACTKRGLDDAALSARNKYATLRQWVQVSRGLGIIFLGILLIIWATETLVALMTKRRANEGGAVR